MSDLENQEVEQEIEVEADPIGDFIDSIAAGDFNQSEKLFNDLLADKVQSSLDAEKIAVADTIFNGVEPEEDIELSDEEIEAELDEE
jgi:hypothetical protein